MGSPAAGGMIIFNSFEKSDAHIYIESDNRAREGSALRVRDFVLQVNTGYSQYWNPTDWPPTLGRLQEDFRRMTRFADRLFRKTWKWPYYPALTPPSGKPEWFFDGATREYTNSFLKDFSYYGLVDDSTLVTPIFTSVTSPPASVVPAYGQLASFYPSAFLNSCCYKAQYGGRPTSPHYTTASGWSIAGARSYEYKTRAGVPGFPLGFNYLKWTSGGSNLILTLRYEGKVFGSNQTCEIQTLSAEGPTQDFPGHFDLYWGGSGYLAGYSEAYEAYPGHDLIYTGADGGTEIDAYGLDLPAKEAIVPMPEFSGINDDLFDPDSYGESTFQSRANLATFTAA
jgi:hypothetical protein